MTSSEIRAEARKSLTGKWGKAAIATLVFGLLTYIISFVLQLIPLIGSLASTIISPVLSFGFLVTMVKLKRDKEISYVGFFSDGFSSFGKIWAVIGWMIIKLLVPIIILIVSLVIFAIAIGTSSTILTILGVIIYIISIIYVVIKSYLYVLSYYVLLDNENMTGKEAVEESARLMQGHRWSYIWLQFTFIGWIFLAIFTLGIGYFWLMPYMQFATIAFYENLAGKKSSESNVEPIQ